MSFRNARKSLIATWVVLVVGFCSPPLGGQVPPYAVRKLVPKLHGNAESGWKLRRAELHESFSGAMGFLEVENTLNEFREDVQFYAEYLDASGRFCFSFLFKQNQNAQRRTGRTGRFHPREVRELYASAFYLNPGVEPAQLKVYALSNGGVSISSQSFGGRPTVHFPIMLEGRAVAEAVGRKLWLEPEIGGAPGPFWDLLLGKMWVDGEGDLLRTEVSSATGESVRDWFAVFIQQQKFRAARKDGMPRPATALILVRALISLKCLRRIPFPPRESTLVKNYLNGLEEGAVPPVISVLLQPDSSDYWRQPSPALFETHSVGAGWHATEGVEAEVPAEGKRSPQGPPLARRDAPSEFYSCP